MILDANTLTAGTVLRARFCVIGSGMAGSAVARKLVSAGQDVLVVEAGGAEACSGAQSSITAEHAGRSFGMPVTRCIELGGTSNQWHGICAPLDEVDFEPRPWIPGSGWPITRAQLMPFYDEAATMLGVNASIWHDEQGAFGQRMQDFRVKPSVVNYKIFQRKDPPQRWKRWLLQAAGAGALRCVVHAPALELVMREGGARADHLVIGSGTGSSTALVVADYFVVCAGTLETPRLLLNSRSRVTEGLGNTHGLVGRNLLDHPVGHFCKLKFHTKARAPLYSGYPVAGAVSVVAGLTVQPSEQRDSRLPNHYVSVRPSVSPARLDDKLLTSFLGARGLRDLSLRQIWGILTNRDILYRILVTRFGLRPAYRYGDLVFMTEQLPNPESRVSLSTRLRDRWGYAIANIDWRLREADFAGFKAYTDTLFGRGLQSPQYGMARTDADSIWARTLTSAAHHLGTARMADRPEHGVVDPNLQVFGTDNVFICDGSVFPTAGSANPTLTITALSLRLANYLVRRATALSPELCC